MYVTLLNIPSHRTHTNDDREKREIKQHYTYFDDCEKHTNASHTLHIVISLRKSNLFEISIKHFFHTQKPLSFFFIFTISIAKLFDTSPIFFFVFFCKLTIVVN